MSSVNADGRGRYMIGIYRSSLRSPLMWFWQGFLFALQSPRKSTAVHPTNMFDDAKGLHILFGISNIIITKTTMFLKVFNALQDISISWAFASNHSFKKIAIYWHLNLNNIEGNTITLKKLISWNLSIKVRVQFSNFHTLHCNGLI